MRNMILFALALSVLAGCGIKPKEIEAPEGANEGDFPRVYPAETGDDPSTEAAKIIR